MIEEKRGVKPLYQIYKMKKQSRLKRRQKNERYIKEGSDMEGKLP